MSISFHYLSLSSIYICTAQSVLRLTYLCAILLDIVYQTYQVPVYKESPCFYACIQNIETPGPSLLHLTELNNGKAQVYLEKKTKSMFTKWSYGIWDKLNWGTSLLQEGSEWSHPCAGTNQNEGGLGVARQPEVWVPADKHWAEVPSLEAVL